MHGSNSYSAARVNRDRLRARNPVRRQPCTAFAGAAAVAALTASEQNFI